MSRDELKTAGANEEPNSAAVLKCFLCSHQLDTRHNLKDTDTQLSKLKDTDTQLSKELYHRRNCTIGGVATEAALQNLRSVEAASEVEMAGSR